ncbi:MAG: metalloregulator ArsR/SmtB family transcription factor [Planctomycetes bacterium]|jgi:ArsR family transcriptional regulator|nr:metalloregulator ArsR/SmtB family transcription factor [Planctomycetota bacterium]MCL4728898.1 metalloregulator ArsR/SmtB family transcription factor [Planctomycetota bacterium]
MRETADIFKALSDETRLQILALLLRHGELCVCDIESALDTTQSKTSRHLRYLLHAGLVQDRRVGVWVHYRVAGGQDGPQKQILSLLKRLLVPEQNAELARIEARLQQSCCEGGVCKPASERALAAR